MRYSAILYCIGVNGHVRRFAIDELLAIVGEKLITADKSFISAIGDVRGQYDVVKISQLTGCYQWLFFKDVKAGTTDFSRF